MSRKDDLIKEILDSEQKMFLTVPVRQKASCQEDIESFRIMRSSQFMSWPDEALESYLDDVKEAEKKGLNLMTQKYARMDNLIPKLKENPLIDRIAEIECAWQKEIVEKYPNAMGGARPISSSEDTPFITSFETYLKGELETYSDRTLSLLYADIREKYDRGVNGSMETCRFMVEQLGYDSLEDAEITVKKRKEQSGGKAT